MLGAQKILRTCCTPINSVGWLKCGASEHSGEILPYHVPWDKLHRIRVKKNFSTARFNSVQRARAWGSPGQLPFSSPYLVLEL